MRIAQRIVLYFTTAMLWAGWACADEKKPEPAKPETAEVKNSGTAVTPDAAPLTSPAPKPAPPKQVDVDFDALYDFGRQLFDDYAPESVKEEYEFMSRDEWHSFVSHFETAMHSGSMTDIAKLEPDASRALAALRQNDEYSGYADWLAARLELIQSARDVMKGSAPPSLKRPDAPEKPYFALPLIPVKPQPFYLSPPVPSEIIPYYDVSYARVSKRSKPKNADTLMPLLKVIFAAENVPPELAWLAEVESSFNTRALSPVGALGLYQLMPATARALGLKTSPIDERTQPGKNARAAAKLLDRLHRRFDSWPLALAAYNAGEGRVAAALKKTPGATTYAQIAEKLPAETRLYVPRVLATVVVRAEVPLSKFVPEAAPLPSVAFEMPPALRSPTSEGSTAMPAANIP